MKVILLLLLVILTNTRSILFNQKKSNNILKLNRIWNLLDTTETYDTIVIEKDINSCINENRLTIKDQYIRGCYESKTIGLNNIPEWKKYSNVITKLIPNNNNNNNNNNNKNYQIFSSKSNKFINLSEYNNQNFFATANGTYKKSDSNNKFIATVTEICIYINIFNKLNKLVINVNGSGIINIKYEDSEFRIVENEAGAKALQRKVLLSSFYKELLKID